MSERAFVMLMVAIFIGLLGILLAASSGDGPLYEVDIKESRTTEVE